MVEITEQDLERWQYCSLDVCYTLEVEQVLEDRFNSVSKKLKEFFLFQQLESAPALDRMMNKGVRIDTRTKQEMLYFFENLLFDVVDKLKSLVGEDFNINSVPQKKKILSDLLGITLLKKKGGAETCDALALVDYIESYPLLRPFLTLLREQGSLKVFVNTFLKMELDYDNRARTQYKIAGTDTYRLSSVKNAFGTGGNLQNIPAKGKVELEFTEKVYQEVTAKKEGLELKDGESLQLPNCKVMFLPDDDMVFFNSDLRGADAQVVAYDSNCPFLISIFRDPSLDLYAVMAGEYFNKKVAKSDKERTIFKAIAHGTAYLGRAKTLARTAGLLVHEVDKVQKWYYEACPEVKVWQEGIIHDIKTIGYTENIFGARGWYLNKNDPMLYNKAVAWRGQSVISIVTSKGLVAIGKIDPRIQPLMNIHDAVAGQFHKDFLEAPKLILKAMETPLPYTVPLTIASDFDLYSAGYGSPYLQNHNYIMK